MPQKQERFMRMEINFVQQLFLLIKDGSFTVVYIYFNQIITKILQNRIS